MCEYLRLRVFWEFRFSKERANYVEYFLGPFLRDGAKDVDFLYRLRYHFCNEATNYINDPKGGAYLIEAVFVRAYHRLYVGRTTKVCIVV